MAGKQRSSAARAQHLTTGGVRRRNSWRIAGGGLALAIAATALVACGSSDSGTGAPIAGCKGDVPSVTIALQSPTAGLSQAFIADAANLYEKECVHVETMYSVGETAILPLLTSGQAQLAMYTVPGGLIGVQKGVPVQVVYGSYKKSLGALISARAIKTLDEARNLKSCKLATLVPGQSVYASALYLNKRLDLHCQIVSFGSVALAVSAVQSGNYQLGALSTTSANTAEAAGTVNVLLSNSDPAAKPYLPEPVLLSALTGITKTLGENKEAVVRVIRAFNDASKMIQEEPLETVAKLLCTTPAFAGVNQKTAEQSLDEVKPYLTQGENPGEITKDFWQKSLDDYQTWGIEGFSETNPEFVFDKRVDMSYNDAAISKD